MSSRLARDIRTIPNLITLSRIGLLLVAGWLYFAGWPRLGIPLAVLAGVTDYVDGAVARATGQVTVLGEILDQFCDLCYESTVFMVAIASGFFPPWVILVYLAREFWVHSIRRYVAGRGANIPSNLAGKLKTNFVMWGFLPTFLSLGGFFPQAEPYLAHAGKLIVGVGLALSYVSAVAYTQAFVRVYQTGTGQAPGEPR